MTDGDHNFMHVVIRGIFEFIFSFRAVSGRFAGTSSVVPACFPLYFVPPTLPLLSSSFVYSTLSCYFFSPSVFSTFPPTPSLFFFVFYF